MDQIVPGTEAEVESWPDEVSTGAIRTLFKHRELIASLVARDIRSRYKQSVLGVAWALITPIVMTLVSTVVFSYILKVKTDMPNVPYPVFFYVAMLPWTFFSHSITQGAECLVMNFNLITKIYFPREVFPISAVLGKTVDLALGILVLIPLFLIYRVDVSWTTLLVIPIMIAQLCLTLGIVFILASINLFYRDIRHVVPLLTQVWMYMTPIIYPLNIVPEKIRFIYMLNPMAPIIDAYRTVVLKGQQPEWIYLGIAMAVSVAVLALGYRTFKKLEPAFAEMI